MSNHRRRTKLVAGIPPALGAAAALAYGDVLSVFGEDALPEASAATAPAWATDTADGFASAGSTSPTRTSSATSTSSSAGPPPSSTGPSSP
ncbi:hypothetical protein [Streptomyces vilmorinianum]|uniref:hypothetical protein n=1 Tax=Streptomyces vilmorinianum TaxID=3051092 RepID=UPI0010FAEE36|nr:hypothetical protein [Streptomyces vilmorinianum]